MSVTNCYNAKLRYGVKANGWADDTAGMMDFVDDLVAKASPVLGSGFRIPVRGVMPPGDYLVSEQLRLRRARGLQLLGLPGCRLTFTGDPTTPGIIALEGSTNTIKGISFYGAARLGVRLASMNPGTFISTQCVFDDLHFYGTYQDCIAIDWRYQNAADSDLYNYRGAWDAGTAYAVLDSVLVGSTPYRATAPNTGSMPPSANWAAIASLNSSNNEYHTIRWCTFSGYGDSAFVAPDDIGAGVRVFGSQSHNHLLEDCVFDGIDNATRRFGLYAEYGAHFHVSRCKTVNNYRGFLLRDFHLGWTVRSCRSIEEGRFLLAGGNSSNSPSAGLASANSARHGANLGLNNSLALEDNHVPRSIYFSLSGPTKLVGNILTATNTDPLISSGGIIPFGWKRPEVNANMFVGPTDYPRDITLVTYPDGFNVSHQGGVDASGSSVIGLACDYGSNVYYKPSDDTWDTTLQIQDMLVANGFAAQGALPTHNGIVTVDFPDGGGDTQPIAFEYEEDDDGYDVWTFCPRISAGVAPAFVTQAEVVDSTVTETGFDVRLAVAPVGYDVRVTLIVWRQA